MDPDTGWFERRWAAVRRRSRTIVKTASDMVVAMWRMATQSAAARWRQRWFRAAVGVAAALAVLWLVLVAAPLWFVDDKTLEGRKVQNDVRGTLLQGLAGIALLVGLYLTYQQLRTNREGQITERYTRAIDQLGHDQLDVRLGGIYALERIARDSPGDSRTIEEVLMAFIRAHSPWPPTLPGQYKADAPLDDVPDLEVRAPDVAAGLTVLARADSRVPTSSEGLLTLDLTRTDLRKSRLLYFGLDWMNLYGCNLGGSYLFGASLVGANLSKALLDRVILSNASLRRTTLLGTDLSTSYLDQADLNGATADDDTKWPPGFDWKAAGVKAQWDRRKGAG